MELPLPPVAIPTYKRHHIIGKRTLHYLNKIHYPAYLITLFVADDEEKRRYEEAVDPKLYGDIVVGVLGLHKQRKFISEYYPDDSLLLQMDDDIIDVKIIGNLDFYKILLSGCRAIDSRATGLWGVLPNDDGKNLREKSTTHLSHIVGAIFLCRNDREIASQVVIEEKEDYLRSILYFKKYHRVDRFKGAGVRTFYNKGEGGLISPERAANNQRAIDWMLENYSGYFRTVNKKGVRDIILNWRIKL